MSPRSTGPRTERPDTKTLVRLGHGEAVEDAAARGRSKRSRVATRPLELAVPAAEPERKAVHLWFKGVHEPVRARAEIGDSGLQLVAPLPFLELESIVGFTTGEGEALLHGRIRRVQLESGAAHAVPQLSIELGLVDGHVATDAGEAHAMGERALDAASARRDDAVAAAHASVAAPRKRGLSWLLALVIGAATGAGATYAWLASRVSQEARVAAGPTGADRHVPNAAQASSPATTAAAMPRLRPSVVEAFAAERMLELARERAAEQARLQALWQSPAGYEVQPPLAFAADEAAVGAVDQPAQGAEMAEVPQVSVRGVNTHVFIPMRGESRGIRQYELTTPGIAVTVPRARALVPLDNYPLARGIVRRVWLREQGEGVQVRVITKRPAARSVVSFDETGLTIVLTPEG